MEQEGSHFSRAPTGNWIGQPLDLVLPTSRAVGNVLVVEDPALWYFIMAA